MFPARLIRALRQCARPRCALLKGYQSAPATHVMKTSKGREYCLIVEGAYLTESEAEHALRDPFIEDWVEQTGRFRIHNMGDIEVAPGVALGILGVRQLDDRLFEIASADPERPLTEQRARGVKAALLRQDMFDEISVEPREEDDEEDY
jgi:hypothetical protein